MSVKRIANVLNNNQNEKDNNLDLDDDNKTTSLEKMHKFELKILVARIT